MVNIIYKLLKKYGIDVSYNFLESRIISQPDYPSLVSVTDTLDELKIEYSAVIVDKNKVNDLNYPIIIHTFNEGITDFKYIEKASELEENKTLFAQWAGIALLIDNVNKIENKEHERILNNEKHKYLIRVINVCILNTILLTIGIMGFSLYNFLTYLLSILGVFVCALIVLHEMGKDYGITEQLCSADGAHGCDKILKSKISILNSNYGLGDIGFVYFIGQIIFKILCLVTKYDCTLYWNLICAISVLGSFASIYYQWKIVKSWCRMCLIVIAIVWFQFFFSFLGIYNMKTYGIEKIENNFISLVLLITSFIIPIYLWYLIKPLILRIDEKKKINNNMLKWKRDPDLFLHHLYAQPKIDTTLWDDELIFGNKNAPIQIMVICNPYCGPCAKSHKHIEELLQLYSEKLCIIVRFSVSSLNKNDKKLIAVENILNACHREHTEESPCIHPLNSWFEKMNIDEFAKLYKLNKERKDFTPLLIKHEQWCKEIMITHTPTFYINGYELKIPYSLNDLKLLITSLTEKITCAAVVANTA